MSTTVQEVISALNNATNDVAAVLTGLRARLAVGVPATQHDLEQLDAITARLEGLAADPANPVP